MVPVDCFMLHATDVAYRWLRRYVPSDKGKCADGGYHNALSEMIGETPMVPGQYGGKGIEPLSWPRDDPRWPTKCEGCGYEFTPDDQWQLFYREKMRGPDGALYSLSYRDHPGVPRAPAGAMWFADWMPNEKGPDGRCLVLRCPANPDGSGVADWMVDGPSTNGNGWTRTGVPPKVTARPSIFVHMPNGFHGWLTDGVITSC